MWQYAAKAVHERTRVTQDTIEEQDIEEGKEAFQEAYNAYRRLAKRFPAPEYVVQVAVGEYVPPPPAGFVSGSEYAAAKRVDLR